jgi:hypothetical protein
MIPAEKSSKLDSFTKIYTNIIYEFDQELFLLKKNNSKKVEKRYRKLKDIPIDINSEVNASERIKVLPLKCYQDTRKLECSKKI